MVMVMASREKFLLKTKSVIIKKEDSLYQI